MFTAALVISRKYAIITALPYLPNNSILSQRAASESSSAREAESIAPASYRNTIRFTGQSIFGEAG